MKVEAQDFTSEVSNKHAFKFWRKKRSEFFDHSSTLNCYTNTTKRYQRYKIPEIQSSKNNKMNLSLISID